MSDRLPLTLLVIARNEAAAIGRCLDSVPFAAEKLVVDSGSTDGTQQIAAQHGARVVHQDWLGFGPQRNFASTQASHDWILALDADEALSPELAREMQRALAGADAVATRRRDPAPPDLVHGRADALVSTDGRRAHGSSLSSQPRALDRRARARVAALRRSRRNVPCIPFIHLNNPTLVHKQLKTLRYAELKARDWLDRGKPARMWMTPFVFLAAFLKDYFLRLAFLDGWRGYIVAQVAASYAVYKRMRYYEMQRNPASRELAARQLRSHGLDP